MKFPEPKTLNGATSPMILISWFFAVGIFEYPAGRPRPVMSFGWSIIHLSLFLSFVLSAGTNDSIREKISLISIGSFHIFIFASTLSVIVFQILGHMASKHVAASLRELNAVNEMMSKYQIPKEYGSTFKYQIIQLISVYLFIIIMLLLNLFWINRNEHFRTTDFGNLATLYYVTISSFTVDCTFTNLIRYIGKRFEHLNANLVKCIPREGNLNSFQRTLELCGSIGPVAIGIHANPYASRTTSKQLTSQLIWNCRKIHQDLCSIARRLNNAFGIQILLSVTMSSVLITAILYGLYNMLAIPASGSAGLSIMDISIVLPWLIFYIARMLDIVRICSTTSTQSQQMGALIYQLDKPTIGREVREEIQAFSLLLMQNPLHFTASGFFTLDYGTVRSMTGTVTTYLVIMIQMNNTYGQKSGSTDTLPRRAINATY